MRIVLSAISPQALAVLTKYSFPGNVRELENAIEHAFVMSSDSMIEVRHLPQHILTNGQGPIHVSNRPEGEMQLILQTLRRVRGNRTRAASELGMHRTTLWRKLKSYGTQV